MMPPERDYNDYLTSEHWRSVRQKRIEHDKNMCVKCKSENELHVHHLRYTNIGQEPLSDLVTLCKRCHREIEDSKCQSVHEQLYWIFENCSDRFHCHEMLKDNFPLGDMYTNSIINKQRLLATREFIKEYQDKDLSANGLLNLSNRKIIVEHLSKWLYDRDLGFVCSGGGLIPDVINFFRNRKYEVINYLKSAGYNAYQIHTMTGFKYEMVRNFLAKPEEHLELYKNFESEWQGKPKEEITMQKPTNYENTQTIQERTPAEVGGHYLRIIRVVEMKNKNGGDMIMIGYDFAANDKQAGLYQKEFEANTDTANRKWPIGGRNYMNVYDQNGQCSKSFKGFCESVEQSNPGFKIDWNLADWGSQFSKKLVGCVYGNVENEYNGKCYLRSQLRWFVPNDKVASAKAPKDKYLNNNTQPQAANTFNPKTIPDEDLPF